MNLPDTADPRLELLRGLHTALIDALQRTRKAPGVEAVHKARVSARKLRSVLRALQDEIHPALYTELRFELRNVGRAFSGVREADVRRALLAPVIRSIDDTPVFERQMFMASLDKARAVARRELKGVLRSPEWAARMERIGGAMHDAALLAIPAAQSSAVDILDRQMSRTLKRVRRGLEKKVRKPDKLHELRIRIKNARYLSEALAQMSGEPTPEAPALLRRLQNVMGDVHDSYQLLTWLADAEAPAALKSALALRLDAMRSDRTRKFDQLRKKALKENLR